VTITLRTRRAIDADATKTPAMFAALARIAPELAERLDEAHAALATVEREHDSVSRRLRRLHPPAVFNADVVGKRASDFDDPDPVERQVQLADLDAEQLEVSRQLLPARERVMALRREAANVLLREGSSEWSERAAAQIAARAQLERSLGQVVADLMTFGSAVNAEKAARSAANAIARDAVADDEARDLVSMSARVGDVAVGIDDDGFALMVDAPEKGLFGAHEIDFAELGRLFEFALTDPAKAAGQLRGTALGRIIDESTR
jgi:hypothetical protein